jgi:hypothetical protein
VSASEKLKGLEARRRKWAEGFDPAQYVGLELVAALPQIVAVVETAEAYHREGDRYGDPEALGRALAALDEALS